jgi:hypothetical protein
VVADCGQLWWMNKISWMLKEYKLINIKLIVKI